MIVNFFRGFCMALADSVPGVSGGTVAFLMGFFDKFIDSLNYLFKGTKEERIEAIKFLIKLGIGWVIGMGISVTLLANLFDKEIYKMSSLFIGFIIAAIPVMIKEEKECIKGKYYNIIWAIIGIALVVLLSILKFGSLINLDSLNIGILLYIFFGGALAICAMVLPGISGSTILLAFGLYMPIITGVKNFIQLDFSSFPLLVTFGLGVLFGVGAFFRLIKKLLVEHRSVMVYFIIGMMIGSLYAIVVGPTTLSEPKDALSLETFNFIFFIIGILVVLGLEYMKKLPFYKKEMENDK